MRAVRTAALPTLGAALLLCLAADARADSDDRDAERRHPPRRTAEILLDMNDAVRIEREERERGNFRIRKRYGFEYAHRFATGSGPPVIFSIQGPAMPKKRVGLSFEVRF